MSKYRFCEILADMPPLRHSNSGPYDVTKSEVVAWLVKSPWAMEHLFQQARLTGRIRYDAEAGVWRGIGFGEHLEMGGSKMEAWYAKNGALEDAPLEIDLA